MSPQPRSLARALEVGGRADPQMSIRDRATMAMMPHGLWSRIVSKRMTTGSGVVVALLVVAALWRFTFLLELFASPYAFDLGIDGEVFQETAIEVAAGRWTAEGTFYQAPVYPRFLGVIYLLFGANPIIAKLIQIVLSVATCWLVYDIAAMVFDRAVARVALAASAVYDMFLFFANELLVVTLFMFVSMLALDVLIRASTRGRLSWWWAAGLSIGLAAITRGTILPLAAVVPLWIVASRWRITGISRSFLEAAVFVVGVVLMVAPVTIHNFQADGNLVLIASNDGLNFFMGNNPDSDGMTTAIVGIRSDQRGGTEDQIRVAREQLGDPQASPGEISRYWYREALRFIAETPGQAARLTVRKAILLINAYEIGNNRVIGFVARHSRVFEYATIRYALILPLAVAGMLFGLGRRPQVFLLYAFVAVYSIVVIAFVVTARYRLPMLPVLIIFASVAVNVWYRWFVEKGWLSGWRSRIKMAGSIVLAVVTAVVMRPDSSVRNPDAQAFFNEAEAYRSLGNFAAAADWYRRALEDHPGYCDAGFNLARIHAEILHDSKGVVEVLQPLTAPCADDLGIRRYLGLGLCAVGRCDEGLEHLRFMVLSDPESTVTDSDVERMCRQVGDECTNE